MNHLLKCGSYGNAKCLILESSRSFADSHAFIHAFSRNTMFQEISAHCKFWPITNLHYLINIQVLKPAWGRCEFQTNTANVFMNIHQIVDIKLSWRHPASTGFIQVTLASGLCNPRQVIELLQSQKVWNLFALHPFKKGSPRLLWLIEFCCRLDG